MTTKTEKRKKFQKEDENLANPSPFSHGVYKELAKLNGQINRMKMSNVVSKLKGLKLNHHGAPEVLRTRLKSHYRRKKLAEANILPQHNPYQYYVIVDFEATCEEINASDYPHEIIEFPAVLVSGEKSEIVDEFQEYCRPTLNPKLSPFCIELTGISQEWVDLAETFPVVLDKFQSWLDSHELGTKYTFAIVTDGPWDMGRFLCGQCRLSNIDYPKFAQEWINVRKTFSNYYNCKRYCLKVMLNRVSLEFEGRPHCGLDDARNIAQLMLRMLEDGADLQVNEKIQLSKNKKHSDLEKTVKPVTKKDYRQINRKSRQDSEKENSSETECEENTVSKASE